MEEVTQVLWHATQCHQVCRITLKGEFFPRTIHPYGICQTSANKIVLVCYQTLGFTNAGGKVGYRNLSLAEITMVEPLEPTFHVQPDFNPDDGQYKDWIFHI